MRKKIRISESQMKKIIAESTKKVLKEEMLHNNLLYSLADNISRTEMNSLAAVMTAFDYAVDAATRCGISASSFVQTLKEIENEDGSNMPMQ